MRKTLNQIAANPRQLFLIDGLGALLSAFMLGLVLVQLEYLFGIPSSALYVLAFFPCLFALYDFYWYRKNTENTARYLRWIAIANLLYCGFSIIMAFYHYEQIKLLGWIYLIGEIIIVVALALFELRIAGQLKSTG